MNPVLSLVSSAFGAIGSAIAGTPSTAESAAGNGSEFGLSSGGDISSGGGNASPTTGFSITTLAIVAGVGVGGFLLWKHFAK
jgi:hypothetical protein